MGIKRQKRIRSVIIGIFSIILAAVILAPPLWLFISSIANLQELLKIPLRWLPEKPSFERYREILFSQGPESEFRKTMWNSFFIALFVTIICVSLGSLAAYAFSRLRFPGKEKILFVLLFSYMLTAYCGDNSYLSDFLVRYQMLDTKQALILIYRLF